MSIEYVTVDSLGDAFFLDFLAINSFSALLILIVACTVRYNGCVLTFGRSTDRRQEMTL
jgi:hypothetical protein